MFVMCYNFAIVILIGDTPVKNNIIFPTAHILIYYITQSAYIQHFLANNLEKKDLLSIVTLIYALISILLCIP
jgi:hypothetical protein